MPTQSNEKPGAKRFKDIFERISIYREVTNLGWLAVIGDMKNGVPTRVLVWMPDQAPSAR